MQWEDRRKSEHTGSNCRVTDASQIFPVTYVEAMPEPSVQEIQEEAQEEARVFASLGGVAHNCRLCLQLNSVQVSLSSCCKRSRRSTHPADKGLTTDQRLR